jgi:hypothetical protein
LQRQLAAGGGLLQFAFQTGLSEIGLCFLFALSLA